MSTIIADQPISQQPGSYNISTVKLDHLITFLENQGDRDLESLITSLKTTEKVSYINSLIGKTGIDYRVRSTHHSRGLVAGLVGWNAAEHDDMKVKLHFPCGITGDMLTLPNGLQVPYGQIIALGGDFYGVPEQPICEGDNSEERFMMAFNTLGRGDGEAIGRELKQIQQILLIEKNSLDTVMGKGDPSLPTILDRTKHTYIEPSDVYKYHNEWFNCRYDTIMGGHWVAGVPVKMGRMLRLAEHNYDHFQPYSRKVWEVGHEIALKKAEGARVVYENTCKEKGELLLHEAYAISAFSCHFLTDSCAAGHVRVPRIALREEVTPAKLGDVLAMFQHDEDGKFGVNVINKCQNRYTTYGDGYLYDKKCAEVKDLVRQLVQQCADQVWDVFTKHNNTANNTSNNTAKISSILQQIPEVDQTRPNNYPLFSKQTERGKVRLLRRRNVNDLSDSRTTENWWGWSTAALLSTYHPKNSTV